ncbi:Citrate/oxoglutarate carrier protein [Metarhizium anisopliae]|nr:Citrate/oxoglutarate carrier protein [Metarhizium anisopliae]
MVASATLPAPIGEPQKLEKKPIKFSNLLLGAGLNMFEVTTLGQPLEVVKTTMAANRGDSFATALGRIWARGGPFGFYQGLIPWAWIEASTKGATFMDIYRKEGIRGINKGVNAVAIRQMTNWGSRFGLSRLAETWIRSATGKSEKDKLSAMEKVIASGLGGGLSAWNQPIEVIRVEMQSKKEDPNRPKKMTVGNTFRYIYSNNGIKGLYRGVTPRIGLGVWQTICMVAFGDM